MNNWDSSIAEKVREAGYKFGTYLDIDTYQILVTQTGDSGIRKK